MKLLKHIIAVLLVAVLLLPLAMPFFLQLQQLHMQWKMEEALEKKELLVISVSTKTIHWIQRDKECLIDGELFDIKCKQVKGEQTILSGLYDFKEKKIKQELDKQANEQQNPQKTAQFVKLQLLASVSPPSTVILLKYSDLSLTNYKHYTVSFYTSPFSGSNTPPPRFS
jgi:hypothetical protein